jgi:hypothetical protein
MMRIAEIVIKTEAALEELHHYYKFGRHLNSFPQKPYFLFSHCAHLLFSLWLIEQDSPSGLFAASPSLTAILEKQNFAALRYADYSRRMLYANAYEEHLKNEPKWFRFWVNLLQELQGADAASGEAFARQFSVCHTEGGLLEGGLARRHKKMLATLVQGSPAGRLFLHSIWVLEDMISTVSAHIAGDDSGPHAIEQMQCLACLLSQLRRTVILETSARGPYSLSPSSPWGVPSALSRLFTRSNPGLLTVALRPEGGEITCTYAWTMPSQERHRAWVRGVSDLRCAYEEALFKTWPPEAQAHWVVPTLEADHLEAIAQHGDRVLEGLGGRVVCDHFVENVAQVLRNGQSRWAAAELPWNYVRLLDQMIGKLKFACREAKVLGGDNPARKVIANLWPAQPAPPQEQANPEASHASPEPVPDANKPAEKVAANLRPPPSMPLQEQTDPEASHALPELVPDEDMSSNAAESAPDRSPVVIAPSGQSGPREVIRLVPETQTPVPSEAAEQGPAAEPSPVETQVVSKEESQPAVQQPTAQRSPEAHRIDMLTQLIGLLLDDSTVVSGANSASPAVGRQNSDPAAQETPAVGEAPCPVRSGVQDGG